MKLNAIEQLLKDQINAKKQSKYATLAIAAFKHHRASRNNNREDKIEEKETNENKIINEKNDKGKR